MPIRDYKVVDYIKSTGTQYITTDITPNVTDKIVADIKFGSVIDVSTGATLSFIGVRGFSVGFTQYDDNSKDMNFFLGYSWYSGLQNFQISNPNNITTRQDLIIQRGGSSYGGKSCSANATVTITPSSPMDIFGYYNNSSYQHTPYRGFELYVYGINIYDSNNTLTHSLLPVERKSDGELGLYDTIADTFYSNAGTGSFAKGDYTGVWLIDEGGNITNTNFIDLPSAAIATPYPHALWRITEGVNDGLPYNTLLPELDIPWDLRRRLGGLKFKKTTQEVYNQMTEYDPDTVYVLVGSNNIWNVTTNNMYGAFQVDAVYCGDELVWRYEM